MVENREIERLASWSGTITDGVAGWVGQSVHRSPRWRLRRRPHLSWLYPPCRLRGRLGTGRRAPVALAALLMLGLNLRRGDG